MDQIHWGGVAAVLVMYAAFLAVGVLAARKVRHGSASDLIVAGRHMPLWIATMTMTATWVDGGYLIGTAEYTYGRGLAYGIQGGLCFGLSLILGGLFFAGKMRRLGYVTLIDPFEEKFGRRWAAVLLVPAMLGEIFWSAELLVAVGSTFGVMLNWDLAPAIMLSAVVVTFYTMAGGMWSVAYTDAFQLALIPIGLLTALPYALAQVGGLETAWTQYRTGMESGAYLLPPLRADRHWSTPAIVAWWDMSIMATLGGIPWNCYFQRVLSCPTPAKARWHSILAGLLTLLFVIPPLLLGLAAYGRWSPGQIEPARALPLVLRDLTPYLVGMLGLGAIVGAVTSSFSASILSAGAMWSWNIYRPLIDPAASVRRMKGMIRLAIVLLGGSAAVMALRVQSVAALWLFSSDLIFVLLFPQLVAAMFDPKTNRIGSITAFAVSLFLRLGAGEPLLGLPGFLPYPHLFSELLPGEASSWYDPDGALLFPFKVLSAAAGMVLLPVVSRLTARWDPPRPLQGGEGRAP